MQMNSLQFLHKYHVNCHDRTLVDTASEILFNKPAILLLIFAKKIFFLFLSDNKLFFMKPEEEGSKIIICSSYVPHINRIR